MAVIYDFNAYRAPRLLNEFSRQTGGVVTMLRQQQSYMTRLQQAVGELESGLVETNANLHKAKVMLEHAHGVYDICTRALRSGEIVEMVAVRDTLTKQKNFKPTIR